MAPSPSSRRALVPFVILVAALAVTAGVALYAHGQIARQDQLKFESAAARTAAEVQSRVDSYVAMLHGGSGLFAASKRVEFDEFRAYVERLELSRRYPSVQGIGFSRYVPPADRGHVEQVIRRHVPTFHYWSRGAADELHAIIFIEPETPENVYAMGFNMFSEATRREAMTRARDTGAPAATGVVRLVQDDLTPGVSHPGFLMYEPVYRSARLPATVEERRAGLLGFVYSPFRMDLLFKGVLMDQDATFLDLSIYDRTAAASGLLFATPGDHVRDSFYTEHPLSVAGRRWVIAARALPALTAGSSTAIEAIVAGLGVALSLLLFAITRAQVRARVVAERTSEELRVSEEALRAANRSKDEFLAIVSHELRTPLNAIVGWGSMLRRGQVPAGSERHALEVIERNALAQARLVEDLLDISRAVAGRLRLEVADVNLNATLRSAVDAVRPTADAQGVTLRLDLTADLGVVRGDQARMQQIVQNLLANAIKFTKPGGEVHLEASRSGRDACIRVTDTGIGISQAFLPFVFDPFRQADTSTTRAHGGVGLGLAIVRHLVELHGGTIDVSSDGEGRGSTFTVRFSSVPGRQPAIV